MEEMKTKDILFWLLISFLIIGILILCSITDKNYDAIQKVLLDRREAIRYSELAKVKAAKIAESASQNRINMETTGNIVPLSHTQSAYIFSSLIQDKYNLQEFDTLQLELSASLLEDKVFHKMSDLNTDARLYVPDCGIELDLNSKMYGMTSQGIIDEDNLGLYDQRFHTKLIVDHASQGFEAMKESQPGTKAYLRLRNGDLIEYVCYENVQAINAKLWLEAVDGRNLLSLGSDDKIVMYTCNDETGYSVTATLWMETGGKSASDEANRISGSVKENIMQVLDTNGGSRERI